MSKTVESRLDALEKDVAWIKKMLASAKRLKHNEEGMTVKEAGAKGGRAKVVKGPAALSPERRKEIAQKAAAARWKGRGSDGQ